jgi:hypothetical protein
LSGLVIEAAQEVERGAKVFPSPAPALAMPRAPGQEVICYLAAQILDIMRKDPGLDLPKEHSDEVA